VTPIGALLGPQLFPRIDIATFAITAVFALVAKIFQGRLLVVIAGHVLPLKEADVTDPIPFDPILPRSFIVQLELELLPQARTTNPFASNLVSVGVNE